MKIGTSVKVTLTDGTAEIRRGASEGHPGDAAGRKHAISRARRHDRRSAPPSSSTSRGHADDADLNLDGVLEERRKAAQLAGIAGDAGFASDGPRVALVGPTDVGKSSIAKILTNYAVRKQWAPLFVDLDLGQGGITCPATIGAVPVDAPIDAEEGAPLEMPLVYFMGDTSPGNNPDLYRYLVERMATMLDARHASNPAARAAGVVINTMGWVEGKVQAAVHAPTPSRWTTSPRRPGSCTRVDEGFPGQKGRRGRAGRGDAGEGLKLNKSGGVVERSPEFRRRTRTRRSASTSTEPRAPSCSRTRRRCPSARCPSSKSAEDREPPRRRFPSASRAAATR